MTVFRWSRTWDEENILVSCYELKINRFVCLFAAVDYGYPWRRTTCDNISYTNWHKNNFYHAVQQQVPNHYFSFVKFLSKVKNNHLPLIQDRLLSSVTICKDSGFRIPGYGSFLQKFLRGFTAGQICGHCRRGYADTTS